MIVTIALLVALSQQDAPDVLFTKSKLNCKDWADTANYFIDLGEEKTLTLLEDRSDRKSAKAAHRAALICRILFPPKDGKGPLRQPAFGELSLPYRSMPLSAWPEYPLVQERGIWFLLDENYRLGGKAETGRSYIEYCRTTGEFRKDKLPVPSRQDAIDALQSLLGSKRWTRIKWSDGSLNDSYTYESSWTAEMLKAQTRFSP